MKKTFIGVASFLFMIILVSVFYIYNLSGEINFLNFDRGLSDNGLPATQVVLTVFALFSGIIFGSFYDYVSGIDSDNKVSLKILLGTLLKARAVKSYLAAPIVYVGIYSIAQEQPDNVVAFLLAFQNGFFCDSIMKAKSE